MLSRLVVCAVTLFLGALTGVGCLQPKIETRAAEIARQVRPSDVGSIKFVSDLGDEQSVLITDPKEIDAFLRVMAASKKVREPDGYPMEVTDEIIIRDKRGQELKSMHLTDSVIEDLYGPEFNDLVHDYRSTARSRKLKFNMRS